ncbi:MAG TPA: hypothetical protein VN624_00645, partial [Rhodanobacter sp.]|nr:hypothetical protein [Rhodanobacter sp.]
MFIGKFADKEKQVPEGAGIELEGKPVRRQRGMIYWYRWGRHTFDVRVMRKVLDLPEKHDADRWFMADSGYSDKPELALRDIVAQLRTA